MLLPLASHGYFFFCFVLYLLVVVARAISMSRRSGRNHERIPIVTVYLSIILFNSINQYYLSEYIHLTIIYVFLSVSTILYISGTTLCLHASHDIHRLAHITLQFTLLAVASIYISIHPLRCCIEEPVALAT